MPSIIDIEFLLFKEWMLKDSQKLGNRGDARFKKNIKYMLEHFFLNENRRNIDKISTQAMHDELLKFAMTGDIEEKNIPKLS
ncbi:12391_t:CDS:2 [Cetraspora pellucida]|uniref:12391_t:CDS:1 n=1 Tax=Cetraspora pellucida TaxID=1433469 RepID=A0ACA9KDM3_9GLOM|nr:12391_t:CDS:2 [Cetraspora pellucida]